MCTNSIDQVITIFYNWNEFTDKNDADAYDRIVRWVANRPWVAMVALEDIAGGNVDVWGDYAGDNWGTVNRADPTGKQAHNWLNHATEENYDNWYMGSGIEESLNNKKFEIRPGITVSNHYGMTYTDGIVKDAWNIISTLSGSGISKLAREILHASVFQTAFHNEDSHDRSRYLPRI